MKDLLQEKDESGSGFLTNEDFKRCLSNSMMKVTENEVEVLLSELDAEKTGQVNYQEFLKYSYLCNLYIQHLNLEYQLSALDEDNKGLVTVA